MPCCVYVGVVVVQNMAMLMQAWHQVFHISEFTFSMKISAIFPLIFELSKMFNLTLVNIYAWTSINPFNPTSTWKLPSLFFRIVLVERHFIYKTIIVSGDLFLFFS